MPSSFEELASCTICESDLKNALQLPCGHNFCEDCLTKKVEAGKIKCPICNAVHSVNGGSVDKAFKPSLLTNFWINWHNDYFSDVKQTAEDKTETEGVCPECAPKQPAKPKAQDPNKVEPEPLLIKLKPCMHCKKNLCESCRNKHYSTQRQQTFNLLSDYQAGSSNIAIISENLNEARLKKIAEYEQLKTDIALKKIELSKKLEDESKNLIERLEKEVKEERNKIQQSNHDVKNFNATKDAVKTVREKILAEKDTKKLTEICNQFSQAETELKNLLQSEAKRIDPNKEQRLNFTPSKNKEDLIGVLDSKKDNLKIKQAAIPDSTKSKICTIM